ncbi:MAG: hypothetical protein DRH50_13550 [Deltaproteobacteria bacterium]|nr:MAG: hypothetical protein DRH50_13550 [Deltaproteobacteria bacterium]
MQVLGDTRLRCRFVCLEGEPHRMYASASSLDFPGLAQKFAFPDRKFTRAPNVVSGWTHIPAFYEGVNC